MAYDVELSDRFRDLLESEPEMRGRALDGWLRVDAEAVEVDDDLERWVQHGVAYARSLPAKKG